MPDDSVLTRMQRAAERGLGKVGLGTTEASSRKEAQRGETIGIRGVGFHSSDEDKAEYVKRLWEEQDDLVEQHSREWLRNMHYVANHQHIAWHKRERRWIPRKTVPWRIQSTYNICQKAVDMRVSRLTENKPMVSVQAATADREDVEKAEYKETLFWHWWQKLDLHDKIIRARRWAAKCGSGFLKVGYDPEHGSPTPATKLRPRYEEKEIPKTRKVRDPQTGQVVEQPVTDENGEVVMETHREFKGLEEYYVDKSGEPVTDEHGDPILVEELQPDPSDPGQMVAVKNPVPDEADYIYEGEVSVDVRSAFNIRWDRYTDDIQDSWYVQDASIQPGSKILAMLDIDESELKEARAADESEKHMFQQAGLTETSSKVGGYTSLTSSTGEDDDQLGTIDREYLVIETWIWPDNERLRKLWGKKGALLIVVGGELMHESSLPDWALDQRNFVQLPDTPEEGNHYSKTFLRDLVPLQDDINRSRSHEAEALAVRSRLILGAPKGHQTSFRLLGGLPAVFATYRSPNHKPEPIEMGSGPNNAAEFYEQSLAAAADVGSMHEASRGKLPSSGLAAKAIYALQFADERSITETSNLQDTALKRLAEAMDAVARHEYKEDRKIRIVGKDRSYLVQEEITPEDLRADVDYYFTPGSMLQKSKENVRNEMIDLLKAGLIEPHVVKRHLSTAVPDVFRQSYDLQEQAARREIKKLLRGEQERVQPQPWHDPNVFESVFRELLLSKKLDLYGKQERVAIMQAWQAYRQMLAQSQQQRAAAAQQATGRVQGNVGAEQQPGMENVRGAERMAARAEQAQSPPSSFTDQRAQAARG